MQVYYFLLPTSYAPSTADDDNPNDESSSDVAQHVQAEISYYTEMYMQKNSTVQHLT
jgi:hypothetical protein